MTDVSNPMDHLAEQVRSAVVRAFEQAYSDAGVRGLCPEGRYEAAIAAARKLDLDTLTCAVQRASQREPDPGC